jgi:MFS family permease
MAVAHFSSLESSLTCDYFGRKMAIVFTTLMIVIGGILATASHGVTINGMFWMMTVARGVVGFGMAAFTIFREDSKR